jgi:hypothetical protein
VDEEQLVTLVLRYTMPVRQFQPTHTPLHDQLVDRLVREWTHPAATEPVILEERSKLGGLIHVYVIWSDWAHLDRVQRGEVIMDAVVKVMPPGQTLDITIAMGLTPDEADRFGIKWR